HAHDVVRAHRVQTVLRLGTDLVVRRRHDRRDVTRLAAGVAIASNGPDLHGSVVGRVDEALSIQTRAKSRDGRPIRGKLSSTSPARRWPMDETAVAATTGVAQVFDLNALKAFAPDKRVRKMLFKTDQLWSEIACYEPGQSTVMHSHPREEEAIYVLEGTANMSINGDEVVVPAGAIVKFPANVPHDVRNLGAERCVIMFLKINPKVLRGSADAAGA